MAGPGPTFPLHRLVWANRHRELEAALHSRQVRPAGPPGPSSGLRTQSRGLHPGGLRSPPGAAAASLLTLPGPTEAQVTCPSRPSLRARLPALSLAHLPPARSARPLISRHATPEPGCEGATWSWSPGRSKLLTAAALPLPDQAPPLGPELCPWQSTGAAAGPSRLPLPLPAGPTRGARCHFHRLVRRISQSGSQLCSARWSPCFGLAFLALC